MRSTKHKVILNEILSDLTSVIRQKGYEFIPDKMIGKLQTYLLNNPNDTSKKRYFLIIHVSTIDPSFWGISVEWQEKFREIASVLDNSDWAVILLKSSRVGYLIPSEDFTKMIHSFSVGGKYATIIVKEQDLSLRFQFYNWDTFFQILNL